MDAKDLIFEAIPTNPSFKNLVGQKFNMLTVIGYAGRVKKNQFWYCRCDCGGITRTKTYSLVHAKAKSCGCMVKIWAGDRFRTHGNSCGPDKNMYSIWRGMLARCLNENSTGYSDYGARGIKVCERWMEFDNFLADMGDRPKGMSIDRIDVNGNYEPSNCRWATLSAQANNTRRNVFYERDGERLTVSQWAYKVGLSPDLVHARLTRGWSFEDALLPDGTTKPGITRVKRDHTPESLSELIEDMEEKRRKRGW